MCYPHIAQVRPWADNKAKRIRAEASVLCKVLGTSASFCFFINVFMSIMSKSIGVNITGTANYPF